MIKKTYIQPVMTVIQLQNQSALLTISGTQTQGLDDSNDLILDDNGGDQINAW